MAAASVEISSAPEPPSGLDWSLDDGTGVLTLTWEAFPCSDMETFLVRSSAGDPELELVAAPAQDSPDLNCTQTFTTETGMWIFIVHIPPLH